MWFFGIGASDEICVVGDDAAWGKVVELTKGSETLELIWAPRKFDDAINNLKSAISWDGIVWSSGMGS